MLSPLPSRARQTLRSLPLFVVLSGAAGCAADRSGEVLFADDFRAGLGGWQVEQVEGGSVVAEDGALVIRDVGGATVWFRPRLIAPVEITYEAEVVLRGGPGDRLSDLNCFWMAREPAGAGDAPPTGRSGRFREYDGLLTYYVGYGGNENTTTRFRRYDGTEARPLRPEHDLGGPEVLLRPNHAYRIRITVRDGVTEFWRDGERIFTFTDPHPLEAGHFAFRTVRSHLVIRDFAVRRPAIP